MDEVSIYKRALTAEEIERHYHAGLGRVAVWHMDNNWNDSSASIINGTANGDPAFVASSRTGSTTASFDGVDDYVTGDAAKLPAGVAPRAVSTWVKVGPSTQKRVIFNYGTALNAATQGDSALYINDLNKAALSSGSDVVAGTTNLADGRWHFVAGVYEGPSTNDAKIYVDGALDSMGVISTPNTVAGDYAIGSSLDGTGYFNGQLDELIVYDHAVTADNLNKYYNQDMGRVGYWQMENNWLDASGNNDTGTANGGATWSIDAKVGVGSGNFDGVNSYVDLGAANRNLDFGTSDFTLEAWIKTSETAVYQGIFDKRVSNAGYFMGVGNDNKIHLYIRDSSKAVEIKSNSIVTDGNWHHVVGVFQRSGNASIYIDGLLDGMPANISGIGNINNSGKAIIGYHDPALASAWSYFKGLIDDMIVYNRAVTADEIRERFNFENGGVPPPAPSVNSVPASTYDNLVSLSGDKQSGTSIWINGAQAVPADNSTSWTTTYSLQPGTSIIYVSTRDSSGSLSDPVPVTVEVLPGNQQDPDLIGLWHMDGNWMDYSGSGADGIGYNGAGFTSDKLAGSMAGYFDGWNDYVEAPLDMPEHDFTISAWAKTAGKGGVFSVNSGNYPGYSGHDRHMYVNSSGYACFRVYSDTGWCTTRIVNDNAWHQWVLVVETGVGQKAYIDGELAGSRSYDHSDFSTDTKITIGYSADGGSFNGQIDEVSIYKRPLSSSEIDEKYRETQAKYLAGWSNKIKVTVDHTKLGKDLIDFPVRVHLSPASGLNGHDFSSMLSTFKDNRLRISNSNSDYPSIRPSVIIPAAAEFSVQLDFSDIALDGSDGAWDDGVGLRVEDATNSNTYVELKVRPHQGSGFSVYNINGGGWGSPWGSDFTRNNTFGSIKIMRTGSTYVFYVKDGNGPWSVIYSLGKGSNDQKISIITYRNVDYAMDNFSISSSIDFVGASVSIFTESFDRYHAGDTLDTSAWQVASALDVCKIEVSSQNGYRKKIAASSVDGTQQYNIEVERWDAAFNEADLWVKIPNTSSTSDSSFYLYYDLSQADNGYVGDTGQYAAQRVWDNNFKAVYHMAQSPALAVSQILDSTVNNNRGSCRGGMSSASVTTGQAGAALQFDGLDDYIEVADNESLTVTDATIEAWVETTNKSDYKHIFSNYDTTSTAQWYHLYISTDTGLGRIQVDDGVTTPPIAEGVVDIADGRWHYLSGTRDTTNRLLNLYVDGNSETTINDSTSGPLNPSRSTWIGGQYGFGQRYFDGVIDEVRISKINRSPEWIKATYYSLADQMLIFDQPGQ